MMNGSFRCGLHT